MSESKKNTFFGGAAILTAGVIIVKLIGALFKIPLANILGDTGFAHFTNAYNIYNLLLIISTAGLPVALSKTVSEANALGHYNQVRKVFKVALATFLTLGIVSSLVMFFGAQGLSDWQGDSGAYYAVLALSPAVIFVCTMSAFRGFAQGHSNMVPTAISQIIEALCKLCIGLGLAWLIVDSNMGDRVLKSLAGLGLEKAADHSEQLLELGAAGAIFGVTVGTAGSLIFLVIDFIRRRKREPEPSKDVAQSSGEVLKRLIEIAIPITIGSSIVSIVTLIDAHLVQTRLQEALGMSEKVAVGLYGSYQTAMTLYNLPSSLMVPLTASVIPAISACLARKNQREASHVSESALRVAMLIACPMGAGLTALAAPIMSLLYPRYDVAITGPCMAILGVASVFVCVMLLCNSILQASGYVYLPIYAMILGGVVKVVVNYFLVGTEYFNVVGAPIGTLCCFGAVAVLELVLIKWKLPSAPNYGRIFAKPVLASAVMGLAAWACYGLLERAMPGSRIPTLGAMVVAVLIYVILVAVLRIISKDDLALMPKGEKIGKILHIK